jgi:peptide/nickel transport system permease protein
MRIPLLKFLGGKALKLALLLVAVATLSFVLVNQSPIDPVDAYVGPAILKISPEQRSIIAARWGLDRPPMERYLQWSKHVIKGDLGESTIFNEPVATVIQKRFLTSLWLMGMAWTFSGLLGFALGLLSGAWENSLLDRGIRIYAYVMASAPTFWVGILLLMCFSVFLGWFPVGGAWPPGIGPEQATLWQRLHHLILPSLTLSLIGIAPIALHTRQKTVEAMHSDYATFARAQGEATLGIVFRHSLRNVALPAVTLQFAFMGELFGGAVLAEQVFSYPGLGKTTVDAGIRGDVPLLLGIVLFSTLFVFVGNTLAELIYRVVDPRMREEAQP